MQRWSVPCALKDKIHSHSLMHLVRSRGVCCKVEKRCLAALVAFHIPHYRQASLPWVDK